MNNETKCWDWIGNKDKDGYGIFAMFYKQYRAHRWSYEAYIGPIGDGLTIDHTCNNKSCVNPAHLETLPIWDNVKRSHGPSALNARKTHCIRGHELSGENVRRYKIPFQNHIRNLRTCRECAKARNKMHRVLAKGIEASLESFLLVCVVILFSCAKVVNPSMEDRVYFPSNLRCEQNTVMLGTIGPLPQDFVIVGSGRFAQDQKLLDICEEKLLIEQKKK